MKSTESEASREQLNGIAAILAIALPGAGHAYLGYFARAGCIALGVLGLFFGGLFIGGIDVVDRREDYVWFWGEALVGPIAFGVDHIHQTRFKGIPEAKFDALPRELPQLKFPSKKDLTAYLRSLHRSANPGEKIEKQELRLRTGSVPMNVLVGGDPGSIKSLGRVNELGTLFCTIAGMLNLMCVIDAAFRPKADRPTA